MTRRGILTAVASLLVTGCSDHTHSFSQSLTPWVHENAEYLAQLADAIAAEPDIEEIWCIPPATIEARTGGNNESFELEGEKFEKYSQLCVDLQIDGAYAEGNTVVVVLPLSSLTLMELIRLADGSENQQTCGLLSFSWLIDSCQTKLTEEWLIRYTALTEEDISRLRSKAT